MEANLVSCSTAMAPGSEMSVSDQVLHVVREAISAGRLQPGQKIVVMRIAGDLGVSPIPVREAVRGLEAEGLLVVQAGRGAVVAPLTVAEVHELFALRRLIEPERVAVTVRQLRPARLDQLENLLRCCSDTQTSDHDHARAHYQFHLGLLALDGRSVAVRTIMMVIQAASRYMRHTMKDLGTPPDQHHARGNPHLQLLSAVRDGRPEIARSTMLEYLHWAEEVASERLLERKSATGSPPNAFETPVPVGPTRSSLTTINSPARASHRKIIAAPTRLFQRRPPDHRTVYADHEAIGQRWTQTASATQRSIWPDGGGGPGAHDAGQLSTGFDTTDNHRGAGQHHREPSGQHLTRQARHDRRDLHPMSGKASPMVRIAEPSPLISTPPVHRTPDATRRHTRQSECAAAGLCRLYTSECPETRPAPTAHLYLHQPSGRSCRLRTIATTEAESSRLSIRSSGRAYPPDWAIGDNGS